MCTSCLELTHSYPTAARMRTRALMWRTTCNRAQEQQADICGWGREEDEGVGSGIAVAEG
eukprot:6209738-Pleurochrysis_carterae.AAC.2